jgi:hypothetical protein
LSGPLKTPTLIVAAGALAMAAGFATFYLTGGLPGLFGNPMLSDEADVESLFATRLPTTPAGRRR